MCRAGGGGEGRSEGGGVEQKSWLIYLTPLPHRREGKHTLAEPRGDGEIDEKSCRQPESRAASSSPPDSFLLFFIPELLSPVADPPGLQSSDRSGHGESSSGLSHCSDPPRVFLSPDNGE